MDRELTLLAVHAHPDDEVLGTGGLFARCADEGIRTVLVTCTNGEQGDGPGGVKPGEDGHDDAAVAAQRLVELRASVEALGIAHVELLGYRDSGMVGWETNQHPEAFSNIPVESAAERVVALLEKYRPQVVVTYDENGGYGHPDHIQAHRVAVAAFESSGIADKLYYTAVPRSGIARLAEFFAESGIDLSNELPDDDFGTPDELLTTQIDTSEYVENKRKALAAHASQTENFFLNQLPEEAQGMVFSQEWFIRVQSRVAVPEGMETDVFAGLR